ncbi:MAG TPA: methyltransferase domain-containing protein [Guyparkeria sp.]|nr:methyltransferase domain-containing protein [Guyparkeria sp.]
MGDQALSRFLEYDWDICLDIGSGHGLHSKAMREAGRSTIMVDLGHEADIQSDYLSMHTIAPVDAIWCSHTLEHQVDPGAFLRRMYQDLADGGILAVTVPPLKHEIVGGHVTLWNAGLLLYQLIMAGFDCSQARVGTYGYNISVIVERQGFDMPELKHDCGDIETLAPYFPLPVWQGFDGRVGDIDW